MQLLHAFAMDRHFVLLQEDDLQLCEHPDHQWLLKQQSGNIPESKTEKIIIQQIRLITLDILKEITFREFLNSIRSFI